MMLNQEQLTRLSLVRFLVRQAESQGSQPPPSRYLALLTLHDAAEMFLDLAAEYLGVPTSRRELREYWKLFRELSLPVVLPMERAIDKVNRARVALKHHGQLPNDNQLSSYIGIVSSFIEDSAPLCFGIEIDGVSLISLVKDNEVRELLETASQKLQVDALNEALNDTAIAFAKGSQGLQRRLNLGFWDSRLRSITSNLERAGGGSAARSVGDAIIDSMKEIIRGISRDYGLAMTLLSFGIDLRDYDHFKSLTPVVISYIGGSFSTQWLTRHVATASETRWCIDFVINFMLALESPGRMGTSVLETSAHQ
jgi:hypothetical protein